LLHSGETRHQLLVLKDGSLQDYVKEVVRLLVNTIAQALGEVPTYYPLSQVKIDALLDLHEAMRGRRTEAIAPALHRALFLLFADEKEHGGVSDFEQCVIAYLVVRSMGPSEWIRTTEIGRVVAKLMWLTRGVVLYQMETVMAAEKLGSSAYVPINLVSKNRLIVSTGHMIATRNT
jgi:hypothetical protein